MKNIMTAKKVTADPTAKPCDVFDCIAAGIPREEWEAALDNDAARAWSDDWIVPDGDEALVEQPQIEQHQVEPLPTVQQLMRLACGMVSSSLNKAVNKARAVNDYRAEYQRPIDTAELALLVVERLAETLDENCDLEEFTYGWWRAASAVRFALAALPGKKNPARRHLRTAAREFEVLGMAADFLSVQQKREGGAA